MLFAFSPRSTRRRMAPGSPWNLRMPAARPLSARTISIKASSTRSRRWIAAASQGRVFGSLIATSLSLQFYSKSDGFGAACPALLAHDQSDSGRRNIRRRLSLLLQQQPRGPTMRITTIALATAFALSSTFALAQAGGGAGGAAGGSAAGSSGGSAGAGTGGSSGTTMSGAGSSTGSTAGSANGPGSTTNPSGSTIGAGSSPSGSTLTPSGPGSGTGR